MVTSARYTGQSQAIQTHIAEENCNILPSQISQRKARENLSIVKERLFRIEGVSDGSDEAESHTLNLDYRLIHEKKMA